MRRGSFCVIAHELLQPASQLEALHQAASDRPYLRLSYHLITIDRVRADDGIPGTAHIVQTQTGATNTSKPDEPIPVTEEDLRVGKLCCG